MNENNLLLILSVLFSRARSKIWWIYIYQIWSADWKTLFGRSKNYFEATFSNSKASFNKKPNSSTPQWTVAKMTYIWFWAHWLAEHAPKSGKYQFAKYQFANLVGWLQKTLKNDQKVFLSSYL